jgi:MinD superfamily P-loop ATPase
MSEKEYIDFIDQHLGLTTHGVGIDEYDHAAVHEEEHEKLKDHHEAFEVCCEMLINKYIVSNRKKNERNSYRLKHEAERYAKNVLGENIYIPEGALVAAVKHLGLPYVRKDNTTSILIKLKEI